MKPRLAAAVRCAASLALVVAGEIHAGASSGLRQRPSLQSPTLNSTVDDADGEESSVRGGGFVWSSNAQSSNADRLTGVVGARSAAPLTPLRPIIFLHGINGHAEEFYPIMNWINDTYGTIAPVMHSLSLCEGRCSLLTPLLKQRDDMLAFLTSNADSLGIGGEHGFNLVAHSQGALLARSVIQKLPSNLHVRTYVSMAGPQRGQWGDCPMNRSGIPLSVANKMARPVGWLAFYNPVAQHELSFANYWNDPDHPDLFVREADFLPAVNGYSSDGGDGGGDMAEQRDNFLRIGRAVFLGSSDDDCINPPLSSVFEFVDGDGRPASVEESFEYSSDAFGLKTMRKEGRLILRNCPGNDHVSWLRISSDHHESKPSLFELHVLPRLQ